MTATGCPKPAMRSVEYARRWNVTLHVRSAFTWEPGTWVLEEDPEMEQAIVSAVTHDTSEAKVTVSGVPDHPGIAARLFRELADVDVNVDMIVQNVSDQASPTSPSRCPTNDLAGGTEVCQRLADDIGATGVSSDRHRPGEHHRRRHEVEPRRGRAHVRGARRRGHQHRDDLHLRHPHLVRGARGEVEQGSRASTPPSASTASREAAGPDPAG